MKSYPVKIHVSQQLGDVSAEVIEPTPRHAMLVLAHGAGAGMNHPFMNALASELAALGVGTLRFNFPFMELKKKRPDVPAIAEKAVACAIAKAKELYPDERLFCGGKSFGGRMTSQFLSKNDPGTIRGVAFFGFPLHAAGKPSIDRAAHLSDVNVPMLFLQGTRDSLATPELIDGVCAKLPNADLQMIDNADHAFYVPRRKDVVQELARRFDQWAAGK